MLCFRCGSPVGDQSATCNNCGQDLAAGQVAEIDGDFADLQRKLRQTGRDWTRPATYRVGEVVRERYEITDVLGSGALGTVYKALDQEAEVDVALKVIDGEFLPDDEARQRFLASIRRLRDVVHNNVVRYLDVDHDADRCFVVTQLLEGLTLRKIIQLRRQKGQCFSVAEVEPISSQLCRALGETTRVVHGGLKPENVIILPDVLKITDFGLPDALPRQAYLAAQRQAEGAFRYLAPEVRDGKVFDTRADIYSLAAILVELLSGETFRGAVISLHALDADLPRALDDVLGQALATEPADRYHDALELGVALRAAWGGSTPVLPTKSKDITQHRSTHSVQEAQINRLDKDLTDRSMPSSKERSQVTHRLNLTDVEFEDDQKQEQEEQSTLELKRPAGQRKPVPTNELSEDTCQLSENELEAMLGHQGQEQEDEPTLFEPRGGGNAAAARGVVSTRRDQVVDQDVTVPRVSMTEEELLGAPEQEEEEELFGDRARSAASETTQQIDANMIVSHHDEEEGSGHGLVLPSESLDHLAVSGETDSGASEPAIEPADAPEEAFPPESSAPKRSKRIDREARAREALQAFDGRAEDSQPVLIRDLADASGLIDNAGALPRSGALPGALATAREVHAVPEGESPSPSVVAPEVLHYDAVLQPMTDETQAVVRSLPASRRIGLLPLAVVLLTLVGGTVGTIFYVQSQRELQARRELEGKRALLARSRTPTAVTPTSTAGAPEATPAATKQAKPEPVKLQPKPAKQPRPSRQPPVKAAHRASAAQTPRRPRVKPKSPVSSAKTKKVARHARPTKAEAKGKCHPGMAYVRSRSGEGFCIDRYESPGRKRKPVRGISLAAARSGCSKRGLRLCTSKEWMRSCGGLFPYGRRYNAARCNTGRGAVAKSGSKRGCRSPWGVYDLSGNVSEWVDDGSAMGGDFGSAQGYASCTARSRGGPRTGYRCCADLKWE